MNSVDESPAARVAVVTGGAHGLGAAISQRLARDGGTVVVVADIDEAAAHAVADEIVSDGNRAAAMTLDVTKEAEVGAFVDAVIARYGRVDTLVCSAAVEDRRPFTETSDEDWQRVLDVNLKGPFLCMKHAIPHIAAAGGGSVILLGSTLGYIGQPNFAAYCASKGALANLAKQAAIENAPDQIRVNVVSPSACDTGLFMEFARQSDDPDALIAMVTENNPMGRLGTAHEVCETVAFLASPGGAYISGTSIPLDGGLAARRI